MGLIPQIYQTTFTYITTMAQLSHSKATFDNVIFSVLQPFVMMALGSQKLYGPTPEIHHIREASA